MAFSTITVFKSQNPAQVTPEKLKKFAFQATHEEGKAFGWCNIDDLTDTAWAVSPPEKGEFMAFGLRVDTRKVPAPVLNLHLTEALRKEEEKALAEGKDFSARKRKKELKEAIKAKLLSKVEPVPSQTDIAVSMDAGLVYVASTSSAVLGIFQELYQKSFGEELTLLPLTLFDDVETLMGKMCQTMHALYESELSIPLDGKTYTVSADLEHGSISLSGNTGTPVSVTSKGSAESISAALDEGLKFTKLPLNISENGTLICSFSWNSNAGLSSIKLPPINGQDDNPEGVFLERMYLVGLAVDVMQELLKQD